MSVISIFIFLICWLFFVINYIRILIAGLKLKKIIREKYPHIRFTFGTVSTGLPFSKVVTISLALLNMLIHGGSKKSVYKYTEIFMDIKEIHKYTDALTKSYLHRIIRINGICIKFIIIGFAALVWTAIIN